MLLACDKNDFVFSEIDEIICHLVLAEYVVQTRQKETEIVGETGRWGHRETWA